MPKDEKLEEIFEKAEDVATVTKKDDDSMEFRFKGGLIFENMAVPSNNEKTVSAPEPTPAESSATQEDEFHIPETFIIDEKYNTPPTPETPTTIFKTYVPKFSDICETYRMKDDPRPRPKVEPKAAPSSEDAKEEEHIDPIAELEVEHSDAVTVKVNGGRGDAEADTLNVFKFSDRVATESGEKEERTVEDERAEIDKLLLPEENTLEPEPEAVPEPETVPEPEVAPEPEEEEPKNYSIPDPVDDLRIIDYSKAPKETPKYKRVDPEGVNEESKRSGKKKLGSVEFNTQADRDAVKDAFLDSALSIKVRLVAMAVVAVLMLVFENIIASPAGIEISGIIIFPGHYGVIDCFFAAAMLFIAGPEIVRAVKYLLIGRVIPEISLVISFLVLVAYTAIMTIGGVVDAPMYGLLFGIFAVVTVAASHYRVNADFTAFKVASQNMEKQILDRKLTRTLHDENMALDGVIDEYKSRIARIFDTAFVSDFFKRTTRVSENSLSALLPMIISLGAALVTAILNYFLNGGITAAASGFALVFLLSLPAFSILIHKLPYYDAQMAAFDESSTVVGETSYRSFSSVDVIAFEDTDIFGVDDVSLRRMMHYGDKKYMEKAMGETSSLFAAVGGPLDVIFRKTLDYRCNPATDVVIEADGISGMVKENHIRAGTEEYMRRYNIAIPDLAGKRDAGADATKIMYASENGVIYAKFYIRYSFSEQFTMLLPSIKEEKIIPLIYTRDPNISNDLLKALCAGSDSMRVMKKYYTLAEDENKVYERISAEVVICGNNINTLNTVLITKKYAKFADQLTGTELYATVFTAGLSAVLSVFGVSAAIPAFIFALWQIAWCLVLRITSKRAFPRVSIEEDNS